MKWKTGTVERLRFKKRKQTWKLAGNRDAWNRPSKEKSRSNFYICQKCTKNRVIQQSIRTGYKDNFICKTSLSFRHYNYWIRQYYWQSLYLRSMDEINSRSWISYKAGFSTFRLYEFFLVDRFGLGRKKEKAEVEDHVALKRAIAQWYFLHGWTR